MRWISTFAAAVLAAMLPVCATAQVAAPLPPTVSGAQAEVRPPITILISIDGFRSDYLNRGVTPVLSRLAAEGASGPMRPSFPSKTFPNHWTIVTGLRPDRNGITANKIEDPEFPDKPFTMTTDDPKWWNAAEPIWVAAENAHIRTGTLFWPGSSVAFGGKRTGHYDDVEGGTRPEDWAQFNMAINNDQRVNGVLDWVRRPAAIRPKFITVYFDTIDTAGHNFGPDDPRTTEAVGEIDKTIGALVDGLAAMGQPVNLVIVADHGMAATSADRVILIRDIADPADFRVIDSGPYAAIDPLPGHEAALAKRLLAPHPHLQCRRKGDLPQRLHFGRNPRVSAFICIADMGWLLLEKLPDKGVDPGNHGYDPDAPEMRAIFIAAGPAIRPAGRLPAFDNVDVYPLLRDLLRLPPKAGIDGSDAPLRAILKKR